MNISADFGITVTDTLRKNKDKIVHKMELSSKDIDHDRVRSLFSEINFESNKGFLAVTGGRHLELGDFIDSMPIVHVNEIEAIGEGTMSLSGLNKKESTIIVSAGSGTACIHAHNGKYTHCSGTGVGGGLVINKKVINGFNNIAGEWGHNQLPYLASKLVSWHFLKYSTPF